MTAGSPGRGLQDTPPLLLLPLGGLRSPKESPSGTGKGEETPEPDKNKDPAWWTAPVNNISYRVWLIWVLGALPSAVLHQEMNSP